MERKMRKSITILITITLILLLAGCSTTYYGKFITAKVNEMPIEEYKSGDFVVLAFENTKTVKAEGWLYEFWVYKNREQVATFRFQARLVAGSRSFFLVEEIPGKRSKTISHFTAKPNYDRIKERLTSHLAENQ